MEKEILKEWMGRFFLAELTMDEERELYQYLCANEVPAELRKDREVILALCSTAEEDIELPEGAAERLEAMLDGLEEMKTHLNPPCEGGLKKVRPRYTLPHREGWGGSFLLRAACAAAVVAVLFLVIPYGINKYADEKAMLAMVDDVDKDTFDTPEEAMECLMAAYEDIMFAMNTARDNTREAHQALTQSVMTNLNLLKLEPTKNREL
jgi:hypothetical protein